MDRRAFLVSAATGATAVAGCARLGDATAAARDLPERPAELTPDSVAAYVADYEAVRTHNLHANAGASDVRVDAVATFDHASGAGHVATAQHEGTASFDGAGERSVERLDGDPVPYVVDPDRTIRLPVARRRVSDGSAGTTPPLGVRLCNVTDGSREFAVTVLRRRLAGENDADGIVDGGGAPVLSTRVELDPTSAVELLEVTDVRGGYRVTARMENDGVTGIGRIDVGLPSADRGANVDVMVSERGVSAWHLPSFDEA